MLNRIVIASLALTITLLYEPLSAAEFCAINSAELQQHLETAANNSEDDVIRIAAGTYPAPDDTFLYDGAISEEFDLTLIGGYTEFFDYPCGLAPAGNPYETRLDGGDEHRVMWLGIRETTNLTVRNLTFRNGVQSGGPCDSGLHVGIPSAEGWTYSGSITIENNAFLFNQDFCGSALNIFHENLTGNTKIRITNNVFSGNQANSLTCSAAQVHLSGGDSGLTGAGVYVTNNTVVGNSTPESETSAAFCISGEIPRMYVANNNFWGNSGGGLRVDAGPDTTFSLYNNNIDSITGTAPTNMAGNMSIQPSYQPCQNSPLYCLNYPSLVPETGSPLVDAGRHPPQIFAQWYLSSTDILGQPRVDDAGGRVDIGAFESNERFFVDRFEGGQ